MPLLDRLKDAVGVGDEDVTYNYHCRECLNKFESPDRHLANIECPSCGATGSREISRM